LKNSSIRLKNCKNCFTWKVAGPIKELRFNAGPKISLKYYSNLMSLVDQKKLSFFTMFKSRTSSRTKSCWSPLIKVCSAYVHLSNRFEKYNLSSLTEKTVLWFIFLQQISIFLLLHWSWIILSFNMIVKIMFIILWIKSMPILISNYLQQKKWIKLVYLTENHIVPWVFYSGWKYRIFTIKCSFITSSHTLKTFFQDFFFKLLEEWTSSFTNTRLIRPEQGHKYGGLILWSILINLKIIRMFL
jgi:hypothetical protein